MAVKDKPPICNLCNETSMDLVGTMNGLDIYTCPKCDHINESKLKKR